MKLAFPSVKVWDKVLWVKDISALPLDRALLSCPGEMVLSLIPGEHQLPGLTS